AEPVGAPPTSDGQRIYLPLRSGQLMALDVKDGHKVWQSTMTTVRPVGEDAGLVFVAAADAIEALRGSDGKSAWTLPRVKAAAPLLVTGGWIIAATDTEVLAIRAKDGEVVWRHAAGGVRLQPALDGERVYTGADDGRVLALALASGDLAWEKYVQGGVTALTAHDGRVYVGAGDKYFYCFDAKRGHEAWRRRIGSSVSGRIAVDDDRVYVAARDNIVYALDRSNGNQRWLAPLHRRPIDGVVARGHIVFVAVASAELVMFYDKDGRPSGTVGLPGAMLPDIPPDIRETDEGLSVVVVTGGLSNQWQVTLLATAGELPLVPVGSLDALPGVMYLTDPLLEPIGTVLGPIIAGDPELLLATSIGWPVVLTDPPLEPLTTLPGLQLRPLSPALPPRREERGPGG
ncbi:MAG TPA: PQQ-binding-like beta-propeller repeat protein, partial [Vicinamibacterales bacterium]|nr:PQQ-binding-like beta-propeller repeat protein [Vicinamibacterales bacterium]